VSPHSSNGVQYPMPKHVTHVIMLNSSAEVPAFYFFFVLYKNYVGMVRRPMIRSNINLVTHDPSLAATVCLTCLLLFDTQAVKCVKNVILMAPENCSSGAFFTSSSMKRTTSQWRCLTKRRWAAVTLLLVLYNHANTLYNWFAEVSID